MYSVEEIKELLKAFDGSKATKLEIKDKVNGEVLTILQEQPQPSASFVGTAETAVHTEPVYEVKTAPSVVSEEVKKDNGISVDAPMVGVFYAAPAPDKEPYVSVGTRVNKGDVLCLIEAMKLMNEVTAEKSGEITEICVENGEVVEYGQPLFMIK